jgi:uroporphyrinogen-III synthase
VLHAPTIRTLALGCEAPLLDATRQVLERAPDIVVANTGIGMRSWFQQAESWGLGDELHAVVARAHVVARGPKASGAVAALGLRVHERASSERLDEVLALLLERGIADRTIAFQLHGDRATTFVGQCRDAGAKVIEVPVYEWDLPTDRQPAHRMIERVIAGRVHAVTFTSAPAVHNLFAFARETGSDAALAAALNTTAVAACVGSVCAEAAVSAGVAEPLVPSRARLGPLIRELGDRLVGARQHGLLDGRAIELAGRVLRVEGETIELSEREAALLELLLRRSGTVVTKATLLSTLWGRGCDPHVLDVTVARLRRRLGQLGPAVQTVPRRGYRVRTEEPTR